MESRYKGTEMRVLEILGSLHRGGAETMIMNYYRAFDKTLCQMDFVIHAEFENDYRNEAKQLGARVFLLDRPGKIGAKRYINELCDLIKKTGPYDAVHIQTNYQAFLSIIAARRAKIKKIIVHSHSTKFPRGSVMLNRVIMDIVPVKRLSCGEAAGKAFFGKHHFTVINNAINIEQFEKKKSCDYNELKKNIFGENYVIGHIGRFTPQKNHDFLISLIDKLRKMNPNYTLALYGEGELEQEIKKKVKEKKLEKNVKFMGVTEDAATAYGLFDLFVLPSLYEGFPVTLVESQLSKTKTLASDRISRECDLNMGLLEFLPLNVEMWVNAIEKHRRSENKEIQANKYNNKIDEYDISKQWKKLYSIYKN